MSVETKVTEELNLLLNEAKNLINESNETVKKMVKHERSEKETLENMRSCVQDQRVKIKRFKMNIFARLNKRRLKKRIDVLQRNFFEWNVARERKFSGP